MKFELTLFFVNKLFVFASWLFLILFKDHSSHIIMSKHYPINIYEICKTILTERDDNDKDLSIRENTKQNANYQSLLNTYFFMYDFLRDVCDDFGDLFEFLVKVTSLEKTFQKRILVDCLCHLFFSWDPLLPDLITYCVNKQTQNKAEKEQWYNEIKSKQEKINNSKDLLTLCMILFKLDIIKYNLNFDEIELLNNQRQKKQVNKRKRKKPIQNLQEMDTTDLVKLIEEEPAKKRTSTKKRK